MLKRRNNRFEKNNSIIPITMERIEELRGKELLSSKTRMKKETFGNKSLEKFWNIKFKLWKIENNIKIMEYLVFC